jgi:beta-lactamase class A
MRKIISLAGFLCLFVACKHPEPSIQTLRQEIKQIISAKQADVGVSISGIEDPDTLNINNNRHFPLQSVFKFHIALAVLHEVDEGKFTLDQQVHLQPSNLLPDTWSPLREKYPGGNVEVPLSEILHYTVAQSDNNGCDILLRLIGIQTVSDYIRSLGIHDFSIKVNEEEMHKKWDVQFSNWTRPSATTALLKKFYRDSILSETSYRFLWNTMAGTTTGKDRIKGELPTGTIVAHKTGTSDTNEKGITAAINDIGIITLPDGKHFAISVFVANSRENNATNEKIIADISKAACDYFSNKKKSKALVRDKENH